MDRVLLRKAGLMLPHMGLFERMQNTRTLLLLAQQMEDRGDRVTLVSRTGISLIGQDITTHTEISTAKGLVTAPAAFQVLQELKGHEADEYAVTRDELKALNAVAITNLTASDELRAFGETLTRLDTPSPEGRRMKAPADDDNSLATA